MTTVVKSSSSVYSTYISTVDHLPCDIVRSLWLVQACNIAADTEKQKLDDFLKQYPYNEVYKQDNKKAILRVFQDSQSRIMRCNKEALAELESLDLQMKAHEKMLSRGVTSLRKAELSPAPSDKHVQSELLKKQLDAHYREHPLASQVEALQERVINGSRNVIIKHTPGSASGVKIILKIPRGRIQDPASRDSVSASAVKRVPDSENNYSAAKPAKRKRGRPRKIIVEAPSSPKVPAIPIKETISLKEVEVPEKQVQPKTQRIPRAASRSVPHENHETPAKLILPAKKLLEEKEMETPQVKESVSAKEAAPITELTSKITRQKSSVLGDSEIPESYCFCHQPSFGDMIACDFEKCPNGEWFHYKCVGLLNRAEVSKYNTQKWYCSESCKTSAENQKPRKKRRRARW